MILNTKCSGRKSALEQREKISGHEEKKKRDDLKSYGQERADLGDRKRRRASRDRSALREGVPAPSVWTICNRDKVLSIDQDFLKRPLSTGSSERGVELSKREKTEKKGDGSGCSTN